MSWRFGLPVRRPFWGVEHERHINFWIVRVSVWPNKLGFFLTRSWGES